MRMRRLRRAGIVVAALIGLAAPVLAAAPASASTSGTDAHISVVQTLHLVRLNCDDEAEHASDEVRMYINGNWVGSRNDMDGGDWWPFTFLPGTFEDPVHVEFKEDSGLWLIGETWITTDDAYLGEIVKQYNGFHGTHYQYRFTYYVD